MLCWGLVCCMLYVLSLLHPLTYFSKHKYLGLTILLGPTSGYKEDQEKLGGVLGELRLHSFSSVQILN